MVRRESTLGAAPACVLVVRSSGALSEATKQLLPRPVPPAVPVSWIFRRARMSRRPESGLIVPVQSCVARIVTLMMLPSSWTSWSGGKTICALGKVRFPLESTVPRNDGFGSPSAAKFSLKMLCLLPLISRNPVGISAKMSGGDGLATFLALAGPEATAPSSALSATTARARIRMRRAALIASPPSWSWPGVSRRSSSRPAWTRRPASARPC